MNPPTSTPTSPASTASVRAEGVPDLSQPLHIHVVGVGGAGMSAIAEVLVGMGHTVSGSDLRESVQLDRLRALGIYVSVGHDAANVGEGVGAVAVSTAIPASNPEVVEANRRGIPVHRRAEVLAGIAATRRSVAVAGTHGKTTTSSMLALVLVEAGLEPSFIIGGDVNEIGSGAVWDSGDLFVVEADESDGTFLELPRFAAVVTNVEPDHLEHHGSWEALQEAFVRFAVETDGPVVACADDPGAAALAARVGAITYGSDPGADYRIEDLRTGRGGVRFRVTHEGEELGEVKLPVPGVHNALNAMAALVTGMAVGADFGSAVAALGRFGGVARRFEHRGEVAGVTFVDDYAHLPTEVRAALEAAGEGDWGRIVCVFQPHRYSRTEAVWRDYAGAFRGADVLVVTDVYASGEAPRPGITGKLVVNAVLDEDPRSRVAYLPRRNDVLTYLRDELRPGDLCLTLGAGDLTALPDLVQDELRASRTAPGQEG